VDLCSAFIVIPYTQGAQVRITQCYLRITPYLSLPRKHSPDGASPRLRLRTSNCSLLLIYIPRKDERLSWPHKWSPVNCRSSAGQGKFARQRRSTTVLRNTLEILTDAYKALCGLSATAELLVTSAWMT